MVEVTIIALVLGLVACLSSLILLVSLLHYNKSHAGGFMGAGAFVCGRGGEERGRLQLSCSVLLVLHPSAPPSPPPLPCAAFGSSGRDFILWQEARTMIYLKISLSDFLTLFSARTRVWFWDRRPGAPASLSPHPALPVP